MKKGVVDEYSSMMPTELKMLVNDAPKDDLEWAVVMYLFRHSGRGNVITLGKISKFFNIDKSVMYEKLNEMSNLWVEQYINAEGHGKVYYTYRTTQIAADLMVKLVELLEMTTKNKKKM